MPAGTKSRFLRRKQCEGELGISRHCLAAIIKTDPEFPPFFKIAAGIEVIERAEFEQWLRLKRLNGNEKQQETTN